MDINSQSGSKAQSVRRSFADTELSIITLTYNDSDEFVRTALSLQNSRSMGLRFKWIVVDGDSADRHKELVRGLLGENDVMIVEPKRGIYPAMNTGLAQLPHSGHAMFLNSGDCQHWDAANLLGQMEPDKAYAFDAIVVAGPFAFRRVPLPQRSGAPATPLHGALVFCAVDSAEIRFDEGKQIDADSHWVRRIIATNPPTYCPRPISVFTLDGVSTGQSWNNAMRIIKDKGYQATPTVMVRFLLFKIFGWKIYPLIFRKKFPMLPREVREKIFKTYSL